MTDSEIKKALECCKYEYDTKCELCCYNFYSRTGCRSELRRNTLDLINRLQAEIDKLKKAKYIFANVDYCADDLDKALKENEELKSAINGFRGYEDKIKTEAYKECVEKVKEKSKKTEVVCSGALITTNYSISAKKLNNLLKEMEEK